MSHFFFKTFVLYLLPLVLLIEFIHLVDSAFRFIRYNQSNTFLSIYTIIISSPTYCFLYRYFLHPILRWN